MKTTLTFLIEIDGALKPVDSERIQLVITNAVSKYVFDTAQGLVRVTIIESPDSAGRYVNR